MLRSRQLRARLQQRRYLIRLVRELPQPHAARYVELIRVQAVDHAIQIVDEFLVDRVEARHDVLTMLIVVCVSESSTLTSLPAA